VLTDKTKRQQYDLYGEEGLDPSQFQQGGHSQYQQFTDPSSQQAQSQRPQQDSYGSSPSGFTSSGYPGDRTKWQQRTRVSGRYSQHQATATDEVVIVKLECTLQELFKGKRKNLKVSDTIQPDGYLEPMSIEKIFAVNITPGLKKNTQIQFALEL